MFVPLVSLFVFGFQNNTLKYLD